MSIASQLPALIGVVVGGGVSWGAGALTERARFRRELRVRWHERRLTEYAAFSSAAKQTMSILFRIAADAALDDAPEPITFADAKPLLADAFHQREAAFERMRLVGSPEVIAAARGWVQHIYALREFLEKAKPSRELWQERVAAANKKRDEFYAVARPEIGLERRESLL